MKEKLKLNLGTISLKQLRVLKAVAAHGTISRASQSLNVTPPAVTLQMKAFEEAIGMPLTERNNRKLRLTDAGRLLWDTANRIDATLYECGEALEALSGVERGRVAVGVIGTAKYFAPNALAAFSRIYPKVEMRLAIGNREETIAALENYELDLAIMGRPPERFDVESKLIGDHPHIIIAPPNHPLVDKSAGNRGGTGKGATKGKQLSLMQLAGAKFLLREEGSGTRLLMQRLFAKEDLNPSLGMEIGSNETIKQAVIAGLGIALLSAHTVAAELNDGRLAELNVEGMPVVRKWYVVKRKDKRLLPAARALWDFLATSGRDFLPKYKSGQASQK